MDTIPIPHESRSIWATYDGYAYGDTWYVVCAVVADLDEAIAALADIEKAVAAARPTWSRNAHAKPLLKPSFNGRAVYMSVAYTARSSD